MTNALQNNKRAKRLIEDRRLQEANDIVFSLWICRLSGLALAIVAVVLALGKFG